MGRVNSVRCYFATYRCKLRRLNAVECDPNFIFVQHQLLERAQTNLGVVLDNPSDGQEYARILIKIAECGTTHVTIQQYVYTRMEEILGIGMDLADIDRDAFGIKHARLFTSDGRHLLDTCFAKAITFSDIYLQKSASMAFATLLTACEGNVGVLVTWIMNKLASSNIGVWDVALPALGILTRSPGARSGLVRAGIIGSIVGILKRIGVNGNSQHIYDLLFSLWSISLTETDPQPYLASGTVPIVLDFLAAAPSKKVTRVSIFLLKNLAVLNNESILNEMFGAGILRLVDNLHAARTIENLGDIDTENDFKTLQEILSRNYRELSSFERLASEINSGALRWGILHNEKFWRENAKFVEQHDFAMLKSLIALVQSRDTTIVCIALYDIGEFVRFYPNGRSVVSSLGGKEAIMNLITSDDVEVQRHALQCISKVMVSHWEHLK